LNSAFFIYVDETEMIHVYVWLTFFPILYLMEFYVYVEVINN